MSPATARHGFWGFATRFVVGWLLLPLGLALLLGASSGCGSSDVDEPPVPLAEAQGGIHAAYRIAYGPDPLQFGDLRIPPGSCSHPVAVVIHGGCWANVFGLELMDDLSRDLTQAGIATWNIEYRRVGDPGGGYPNTLTDVGRAVDEVRALAATYNLDLDRVITVGHSAGGHLGVWAAARGRLPPGSPLYSEDPLPLSGAVSLAGILNLAEYMNINDCGGFVDDLLGGTPEDVPERYAEASPSELLPIRVRQVLIQGTADVIVPLELAQHYRSAARHAGDRRVSLKEIRNADHFDVIDPTSRKWPQVKEPIIELVR